MATVVEQLQFLGATLCANTHAAASGTENAEERARRRRKAQEAAARSKTGLWGPTHSMDSEDSSTLDSARQQRSRGHLPTKTATTTTTSPTPASNHLGWWKTTIHNTTSTLLRTPPTTKSSAVEEQDKGTDGTHSTKSSYSSVGSSRPTATTAAAVFTPGSGAAGLEEATTTGFGSSAPHHSMERIWGKAQSTFACQEDTTTTGDVGKEIPLERNQSFLRYVEDACSPCQPRSLHGTFDTDDDDDVTEGDLGTWQEEKKDEGPAPAVLSWDTRAFRRLGISQMEAPSKTASKSNKTVNSSTSMNNDIRASSGASKAPLSQNISSGGSTSTQNSRPKSRQQSRHQHGAAEESSVSSVDTPAERRRQRHRQRQLRVPPPTSSSLSDVLEEFEVTPEQVLYKGPTMTTAASMTSPPPSIAVGALPAMATASGKIPTLPPSSSSNHHTSCQPVKVPLDTLTVKADEAYALQRSISELTMRSSYGEATAKLAENRRMAYYAVGRHHRNSGRGGNRRCYFTGRLILGGAPFYAGSVQQGLRTLVVFCLPSAIGLPKGMEHETHPSYSAGLMDNTDGNNDLGTSSHHNRQQRSGGHSLGVNTQLLKTGVNSSTAMDPKPSLLSRKGSRVSRLSSVDDMSLSIEEEMDVNYDLDREYLLSVLPDPAQDLLDEMASRYPAQFETLPVQVRSPHCWRLYVKFCFFSGLPIAEGEMHYQVREEISEAYGEEIILSHEVMEAVNGDSAEILRLPNLKTFRYLRKHYSQQSGKLPEQAFMRQSWEMVRPEV